MEKINIAELLKDCPKGMELDCALFNNSVTLNKVADDDEFPITIETAKGNFVTLTKYGTYAEVEEAKCVIFPKGMTTWEGFVPPCNFKDGDILYVNADSDWIFIYRKSEDTEYLYKYAAIRAYTNPADISYLSICDSAPLCCKDDVSEIRLATDKEKEKLFQAIKDNGYKWNTKTKTLKKFPKFKVGDRIRQKGKTSTYTITDVNNAHYFCGKYVICDTCDNDWELVPNKFDISTLVPFESKVLVRSVENQFWRPAIWGVKHLDWDYYCVLGGEMWEQCIPYEGNEHLLGTTDDCEEYYKTWK